GSAPCARLWPTYAGPVTWSLARSAATVSPNAAARARSAVSFWTQSVEIWLHSAPVMPNRAYIVLNGTPAWTMADIRAYSSSVAVFTGPVLARAAWYSGMNAVATTPA